jgi:hypothetical protein
MRTIVIYPGRFHPFHRGHKSSYDYLTKQFGANNVFIATSAVQAPVTSPFTFSDKMAMMTKLGIPAGRIAQVTSPYQAKEITSQIDDKEHTVLIFAVSEKDMTGDEARFKFGVKKNGELSYMQPYPSNGKKLQPMSKHAYVMVTPTVNFKVKGVDANSASQIRKLYLDGNDNDRDQIIADLYGEVDTGLRDIFDQRLGVTQKTQAAIAEARRNPRYAGKTLRLLEAIQQLERLANLVEQEDLVPDYINEKRQ